MNNTPPSFRTRYASFMLSMWGPQSRAERLVLAARVVLVLALSASLNRDASAGLPTEAVGLWILYVAYTILFGAISWSDPGQWGGSRLSDSMIDLGVFSVIIYFSDPISTPFYGCLYFALCASTLRYGTRGVVVSSLATLTAYLTVGMLFLLRGHALDLNRFSLRLLSLGVAAALLAYATSHRQRIEQELVRLSSWSHSPVADEGALVAELLSRAAAVVGVSRVVLAVDDLTARRAWLARSGQAGALQSLGGPLLSALFDLPVAGRSIFVRHTDGNSAAVLHVADEHFEPVALKIDDELLAFLNARSLLIVPFEGRTVTGRLVFLDRTDVAKEDVAFAELLGGIVSTSLDQHQVEQALRSAAVAEERVRLGRDLHDWLLQSLTGAALQLQTLHRLIGSDPELARSRLLEIQQVLTTDQQELRWFIDHLKPGRHMREENALLAERLAAMAERFRRQWDLRIELEVAPVVQLVRDSLRHEIYSIINEAVANAAKHANATMVSVEVGVEDNAVLITVLDNGRGFPFSGTFDLLSLEALKRGPVTLKERVSSLGGNLSIESRSSGARINISVPITTGEML